MKADMSPEAITIRLRRVSQLRRLCVSLRNAGRDAGLSEQVAERKSTELAKP
jgi:hypothetical protein